MLWGNGWGIKQNVEFKQIWVGNVCGAEGAVENWVVDTKNQKSSCFPAVVIKDLNQGIFSMGWVTREIFPSDVPRRFVDKRNI